MKTLSDRIVMFGDRVGKIHFGSPKGEILLKRFVDSQDLPPGKYLLATTNTEKNVRIRPSRIRKVLVLGIRLRTRSGIIDKERAALALINWQTQFVR